MINRQRRQRSVLSFLLSLVIHLLILGFIVTGAGYWYQAHQSGVVTSAQAVKSAQVVKKKLIVKAVTVNESAVQHQIQAIKQREKAKHAKQVAWQKHLQSMAKQAVMKKNQAQKQLSVLQVQRQQVQKKTAQLKRQAKAQLARIKALQAQAEMRLTALRTQQEALSEQNTNVMKRLAQTKAAIANETSTQKKNQLISRLQKEKAKQAALAQQQMLNQLSKFKTLILNDIGKQWIIPAGVNRNLSSKLLVELNTKGEVMNVAVIQSSGDAVLDRSAVTAVLKASPLPVPQSPALLKQFRQIELTVKPEGLLSEQVNLS